jgi:hypothetical protein
VSCEAFKFLVNSIGKTEEKVGKETFIQMKEVTGWKKRAVADGNAVAHST